MDAEWGHLGGMAHSLDDLGMPQAYIQHASISGSGGFLEIPIFPRDTNPRGECSNAIEALGQ